MQVVEPQLAGHEIGTESLLQIQLADGQIVTAVIGLQANRLCPELDFLVDVERKSTLDLKLAVDKIIGRPDQNLSIIIVAKKLQRHTEQQQQVEYNRHQQSQCAKCSNTLEF
jgi:hypothetical protein